MPDPISSATRPYETCDPSNASCLDLPVVPPATAAAPAVVTIEPVVVKGDAGAQDLIRRYDALGCLPQRQNAEASCAGIIPGVVSTLKGGLVAGLTSTAHASLICGKDLRSVADCNQTNASLRTSLAEVITDCHERDGAVKAGSSLNEIICEVEP